LRRGEPGHNSSDALAAASANTAMLVVMSPHLQGNQQNAYSDQHKA
jgi:hypothetical protein